MSLYDELKTFRNKDKISFHIPGHRFGRGLNPGFRRNGFEIDVTEFDETDDLQRPKGILADALSRAAEAFGAGATFYVTNGSSGALNAAIYGACRRGDKLIVDRTCHRAVISAIVMRGIIPVFVQPEFDEKNGLYIGMTALAIQKALDKTPDASGAVVTSPTYYGVCSDISEISDILHKRGKFLIVDEAHGAHFAFHPELPQTALESGADIVIQSAHKTLPAMGQTSLLHIGKGSLPLRRNVERALRLFHTTSPSYMMMASVDEAVIHMQNAGRAELNEMIKETESLKAAVGKLGVIDFFDSGSCGKAQDMLRLVADVRRTGKSGTEVSEILKNEYGIYAEMSDLYHVVFVITCANTKSDIAALKNAFVRISKKESGVFSGGVLKALPDINLEIMPSEAWDRPGVMIPAENAEGRISADILAACPPGAAILVPGQVITKSDIECIKLWDAAETVSVLAN